MAGHFLYKKSVLFRKLVTLRPRSGKGLIKHFYLEAFGSLNSEGKVDVSGGTVFF